MAKRKEHSLTGRITFERMLDAFKSVKRNRGAAGIDKVSVQMFDANLEENLLALMRAIKGGSFQPRPLRRAYIPKTPTRMRPLGIPAVRDRVAQEVLRRLLSPIFERQFHDASYGFRPERNCHQAVEHVLALYRQGYKVVLDADIQGFFDNIPHAVIMAAVAAEVADGNILRLIERFLKSGVMDDGVFKPTTIGTPQGGVISPLLANIVLNRLDWQLHEAGYPFVRYADDFVVLCKTRRQAREARTLVEHVLRRDLGLTLNPDKTQITTFGKGFSFLGFDLSSRGVRMRAKSVEKLKDKVREHTRRHRNLDAEVIERLNRVLRGTANYFVTPFSNCRWQYRQLDAWIRMRLRCMKYKRKSYSDNMRMRLKHFRRLGLLGLLDFCLA
jgi:RNA-directed DNA polymerase